jgi:AraC family ethanolamine operon transcriptional activator
MSTAPEVGGVQTACLTTYDPASFELVLRPWELLCRPSTRGEFKHSITLYKTPLFTIYHEKFTLAAQVLGLSPAGTLVLAIPLGAGEPAEYWRVSHSGTTLPATLPGSLDVMIKEGHNQMVFLVDLDYCRRCLDEQLADVLLAAASTHILPIRDETLNSLVSWGKSVLNLVRANQVHADEIAVRDSIMQELVYHLSLIASELEPASGKATCSARQMGIRRAVEYLRYNRETRVSVPELLKVAGISERSLQYAFKEAFDMTPQTFVKRRRLHFARQQLLVARARETSVSRIATGLGFYELGRFASDYRQIFGEFPSETLRVRQLHRV